MSRWTLFSNHGHVLLLVAREPEARLRDVAAAVGITERAVQKIIRDLQDAGMLSIAKHGRRNRYRVHTRKPLRHDLEAHCNVGQLVRLIGGPEQDNALFATDLALRREAAVEDAAPMAEDATQALPESCPIPEPEPAVMSDPEPLPVPEQDPEPAPDPEQDPEPVPDTAPEPIPDSFPHTTADDSAEPLVDALLTAGDDETINSQAQEEEPPPWDEIPDDFPDQSTQVPEEEVAVTAPAQSEASDQASDGELTDEAVAEAENAPRKPTDEDRGEQGSLF